MAADDVFVVVWSDDVFVVICSAGFVKRNSGSVVVSCTTGVGEGDSGGGGESDKEGEREVVGGLLGRDLGDLV